MVKPSPHAGSAAVNRQVCAAAAAAAADGLTIFDAQMSALELAAAHNDETTMIASATLIRDKLVEVAATLAALSHRSTSAPVTAMLARASRTLHEMSSESYEGTSADQRRTLAEIATTFAEACD
jgi:uroporphyrinogen-III decarboxylase